MNVDPSPGVLATVTGPPIAVGQLGDDREAEPSADRPVGAVAIPEIEALERASEVVGGEARAGRRSRRAVPGAASITTAAALRRAADRVLDEIRERLQRATGVGDRRRSRARSGPRDRRRTALPEARGGRAPRSATSPRSTGARTTSNDRRRRRARSSRSRISRSSRCVSRSITSPARSGVTTPSLRPSAWPRIAVSGVFSSWLTERRKARSASCARRSSSESSLNDVESCRSSVEPSIGSGSGLSSLGESSARRGDAGHGAGNGPGEQEGDDGREDERRAALRGQARRGTAVQSSDWFRADRSSTIASPPPSRAAYRNGSPRTVDGAVWPARSGGGGRPPSRGGAARPARASGSPAAPPRSRGSGRSPSRRAAAGSRRAGRDQVDLAVERARASSSSERRVSAEPTASITIVETASVAAMPTKSRVRSLRGP